MSRKILVMAHMGRQEAKDAARDSCLQLHEAGLVPVISRDDLEALQEDAVPLAPVEVIEGEYPVMVEEQALRPGCTALASSRAPTSRSGARCCR